MYKQHEQNQNEQKLLEYLQNENPIHLQTSFISKNSSDSENDQEYDVNLIRNNTITTILNQSNIQIQKNAKQSQAQQQLIENVGDLKQYKQVIFASEKYRDQKKNNVTDQNRIYYQLYYGSGKFRKFLMIILLLLGFFEKPSWCSSDYIDDCSRLKNNSEIQIKLSQVPYINSSYLCILESSIIIILTLFKMIKSEFQKSDLKQQLRLKGFIIITIFQIIYHICKQFGNFDLLYNGILRIAYFVLYQRSIRRTLFTYIQLIKKGYPIFAMMCFNLFLFACIAKILFGRIDQAKVYFNTLTDGIYYLLILQTTANFPDIMLPSYKEYRVSSIFFISFLALNYLLLFNMLIGIFYLNYKKTLMIQTKYIKNYINKNGLQDQDLEKIVRNYLEQQKSKQGQLPKQSYRGSIQVNVVQQNIQQTNQLTSMQQFFLQNQQWETIISLISLSMIIIDMIDSCMDQEVTESISYFLFFFLTHILLLDTLIKLYLLGIRKFYKNKLFLFELLSLIITVIILVIKLSGKIEVQVEVVKVVILTRLLRVFRLLKRINEIRTVYNSIIAIIPYSFENIFALLIIYYLFALIGIQIFGGKVNSQEIPKLIDNNLPSDYIFNNFNDLGNGFMLLFELMIVNNWYVNVEVHCVVMNSKIYRIFFIVYYIISVILCLNIIIAFIIEFTVNQWDEIKNNSQDLEENLDPQLNNQL